MDRADRIPPDVKRGEPWLFYWLGMGCLATDPPGARPYLERHSPSSNRSPTIPALFCRRPRSCTVSCLVGRLRPLDRWIDWIDRSVDPEMPLPPPDVEAHVAAAMVCGLTWRAPWHPRMATWIDRALQGEPEGGERRARIAVRGTVMEYHAHLAILSRCTTLRRNSGG